MLLISEQHRVQGAEEDLKGVKPQQLPVKQFTTKLSSCSFSEIYPRYF